MNEADPRVKRTRKLLQDAFMELLAEKSFHAITVLDIAERATLNRATFYAHFEDKYALIDHMVREQFREALGRHVAVNAPFTLDNLHLLVVTTCEYLGQFQGHCAPPNRDLDPRIEAKVQEELHVFLSGWMAPASPDTLVHQVRLEAAASVTSWAIFGAGIEWSRGKRTRSADDWAGQVVTVLMEGISQMVYVPAQASQAPLTRTHGHTDTIGSGASRRVAKDNARGEV